MILAIIGGGASGFMAAITVAETFPESKVIILEKSRNVLAKVRISGGGRCNVTHRHSKPGTFAKHYPRGSAFMKSILPEFDAADTVRWFESRGVKLKTEADGRMFPVTDSSDTVIHCLIESARKLKVDIRTGVALTAFRRQNDGFSLELHDGSTLIADRVLIATGGYPKPAGFDWLAEHGHDILPPVPSLFTFNTPGNYLLPLAGVSVQNAKIRILNSSLRSEGPVLITHWGFSGPAILKLSAWGARELAELNYQFKFRINWTGDANFEQVRQSLYHTKASFPRQQLAAHPEFGIPARLWRLLADSAGIAGSLRLADTAHKLLNKMAMLLTDSEFDASGKTTFKEEFVTCGGISLDSIHPDTMESKKVKGLFFAGEVLNVDGITGGFNFQHAWSTGYIAGTNMGKPAPLN